MDLDDTLNYPWVGPNVPPRIARILPRENKAFGQFEKATNWFRPQIIVQSFGEMVEIVQNGDALSFAMPSQIKARPDSDAFKILPIQTPWLALRYGFATRRNRSLSPALALLMRGIRTIESKY